MEERRGRSLRVLRTVVRVPAQNRRGSQRLACGRRCPERGLLYDLIEQMKRATSPDVRGKVLPARERREVQRFDGRILETVEFLSPVARGVLLGAIEPVDMDV